MIEVEVHSQRSAVADLGLAVNRVCTAIKPVKGEEVTYVDVELWGRLAEIAGRRRKVGRSSLKVGCGWIPGRTRQSGQKRNRLKVVGEGLQLLGSRPGGGVCADDEGRSVRDQTGSSSARPALRPANQLTSDIPF